MTILHTPGDFTLDFLRMASQSHCLH